MKTAEQKLNELNKKYQRMSQVFEWDSPEIKRIIDEIKEIENELN